MSIGRNIQPRRIPEEVRERGVLFCKRRQPELHKTESIANEKRHTHLAHPIQPHNNPYSYIEIKRTLCLRGLRLLLFFYRLSYQKLRGLLDIVVCIPQRVLYLRIGDLCARGRWERCADGDRAGLKLLLVLVAQLCSKSVRAQV